MDLQPRHQDQEPHLVFRIIEETLIIIKGGNYFTENHKVSTIKQYSFKTGASRRRWSLQNSGGSQYVLQDKLVVKDIAKVKSVQRKR